MGIKLVEEVVEPEEVVEVEEAEALKARIPGLWQRRRGSGLTMSWLPAAKSLTKYGRISERIRLTE